MDSTYWKLLGIIPLLYFTPLETYFLPSQGLLSATDIVATVLAASPLT